MMDGWMDEWMDAGEAAETSEKPRARSSERLDAPSVSVKAATRASSGSISMAPGGVE